MSKHTKGPWCAAIDECATVRDSRDNQLAMVTYLFTKTGGRRSGDEVSANARLIAAAPELLEELEQTQILLESLGLQSSDEYQANAAAIAKAKGEK